MVYASGSLSLALLEILVHVDPAAPLPELCAVPIYLPVDQIATDHFSALDQISGGLPWSLAQTRTWGDTWNQSQQTPALQVPSMIVPNESNYLINPLHPAFKDCTIEAAQAFSIDARLML